MVICKLLKLQFNNLEITWGAFFHSFCGQSPWEICGRWRRVCRNARLVAI